MNIFHLSEILRLNADSGSFLFGVLIAVLFLFKYKQLEAEAEEREMLEHFLE